MSDLPLLDLLPDASAGDACEATLVLEGHLLRGTGGGVRIAVAGLVLAFDAADVVDVVELPETMERPLAIAARLTLRCPARLIGAEPAEAYRAITEPQLLPFAYLARPEAPPMQPAPRFEELQEQFKQKHGLA